MARELGDFRGILARVTLTTGISSGAIVGPARQKGPSMARALFAYLLREELGWSYPRIAKAINRTHPMGLVLWRRVRESRIYEPQLWGMVVAVREVRICPYCGNIFG